MGYVARIREMCTKFLLESLKGRDHLEDTGVDGRRILKWISRKWGFKVWLGFIWFKTGTSGGLL
jgi:hypothetical protein